MRPQTEAVIKMPDKKKRVFQTAALAVYMLVTLAAALNHELWFDEGQAWCIVRDNDFRGIIEQLRYEGHPALWYLILLPFARLGLPCDVIPLISWAFSAAAAYVIMFRAPFGNFMKAAVIFSGGFLFYNSVISRPYCVIQLLLALIAVIYPQRKKRPVLYGTLVALLANTHVCMCGLVGMLGIFMLADLYADIKAKKNIIFPLAGLGTAGLGVIAMILPIIGSLGANNMVSDPSEGMSSVMITDLLSSPADIMTAAVFSAFRLEALYPLAVLPALCAVFFIILIRRNRRWLISALVFSGFFVFIDSVIWRTNTNRSVIFIYTMVFFYWLALDEKIPKANHSKDKITSKLVLAVMKADENPAPVCAVLLCVPLLFTFPAAAYSLAADIAGDFSPSKKAAEFIRGNYEKSTVIVIKNEPMPQVAAYIPEYSFYSAHEGGYSSYYTHRNKEETEDYSGLEGCGSVIGLGAGNEYDGIVFTFSGYVPFDVNIEEISVYSISPP